MVAQQVEDPNLSEDSGLIPGITQGVMDPVLPWLWCRPAAAINPYPRNFHMSQMRP